MEDRIKKLLDSYPFLSFIAYGGNDYIGVIQNHDETVTSIYDFSVLQSLEMKQTFLALADEWWWGSNRLIPINVFLKQDWVQFRPTLKTFNSKDVKIQHGPYVSLRELAASKSKRRSIVLVRKVP